MMEPSPKIGGCFLSFSSSSHSFMATRKKQGTKLSHDALCTIESITHTKTTLLVFLYLYYHIPNDISTPAATKESVERQPPLPKAETIPKRPLHI